MSEAVENRMDAGQALQELRDGNARFVAGETVVDAEAAAAQRDALVAGQKPLAIILGCSDARVPAEIVFDQGLGDLFVIRVAGNIVAPSQVGSIEFAAAQFGTRLVVVLGHTRCGAVQATVDELGRPTSLRSPNLHAIVDRIRPAIEHLTDGHEFRDRDEIVAEAVRANVRASAAQLLKDSTILTDLAHNDGLQIVGAEYALETGVVHFLDD